MVLSKGGIIIKKLEYTLKESKYNFFCPSKGQENDLIAFNTRTFALAKIPIEKYKKLEQFSANSEPFNDDTFVSDLYSGGFLVDRELDELKLLKHKLNKDRYSNQALLLTIAPTLKCNFNCIYCFEQVKEASAMTTEIQDNLIQFINNASKNVKEISIAWYGGEPLLAFDVIKKISIDIMNLCKVKNIKYSASLITNGYLLSGFEAKDFLDLNINSIQVTIDGIKEIHDRRRMLINGKSTYDMIMTNVTRLKDDIKILIRINVDKTNKDMLRDLILEFKANGLASVRKNIAHVQAYSDMEHFNIEDYLNTKEFCNCLCDFNDMLIELDEKNCYTLPRSCSYFCDADFNNAYVIDAEGYIYKCWADIGNKDLSVDNLIKDNKNKNISRLLEYITYDSTEDTECKECKYLPICMGGCPHNRISKIERCTKYKYMLDKYLNEIIIKE